MPQKSVSSRLLDNPIKYQKFIRVLFERRNFPDILTSEFLRNIFKEVFLSFPSCEEVLQFRNFICSRRDSIEVHIKFVFPYYTNILI